MGRIQAEDLRDNARLDYLYRGALCKGWISPSSSDRVNYWGAAEHALAAGGETAGNLFAWVVLGKRWDFITEADEGRALARLKRIEGEKHGLDPAAEDAASARRARDARMGRGANTIPGSLWGALQG